MFIHIWLEIAQLFVVAYDTTALGHFAEPLGVRGKSWMIGGSEGFFFAVLGVSRWLSVDDGMSKRFLVFRVCQVLYTIMPRLP
jgi:hypothetical protein